MKIGVEVRRSNTIQSRMTEAARRIGIKVEAGIHAAADVLLEESRALVPTDTHALKESGGVRPVHGGLHTEVIVGYGPQGFTVTEFSPAENKEVTRHPYDYAWYVHEIGSPRSTRAINHPHGQANFLLEPAQTKLPEMRAALHTKL